MCSSLHDPIKIEVLGYGKCYVIMMSHSGLEFAVPPAKVRVHNEGALPHRVDVLPDGGGAYHSPFLLRRLPTGKHL